MSSSTHPLESLFTPKRIALVGASETGLYPAGILQSLQKNHFRGVLYPVNPKRETLFGLPAYPDVTRTPSLPDLAILTVPRSAVLPVIQQCLQVGVQYAVIITAGFAEADGEGRHLQAELNRLVTGSSLRIFGPNCAGLADIPANLIATRLPAPPRPGEISFISQSGALMMAFYGLYADRKIGMNRLVSLGNQVDVSIPEVLACLVEDEHSQVITVFLEGVSDGQGLVTAAQQALRLDKPLVLLKSGQSEAGQRAAASHTAALAGSQEVFRAVCRQFGIILVKDIHELVQTAQVCSYLKGKVGPRFNLALITQSGGLGSLTADLCSHAGIHLHRFNPHLKQRLAALPHLFHFGDFDNPADVRADGLRGKNTSQTLQPFLEDEETDGLVLLLAKRLDRPEDLETAQAIITVAQSTSKPILAVWVGPDNSTEINTPLARDLLLENGVPTFEQPGDLTRAMGHYLRYRAYRQAWLNHHP